MVRIFLIRHAESVSNLQKKEVFETFGLDPKNTKLCLAYKLVKDPKLIDAQLSEKGHEQCEASRVENAVLLDRVKHVLCSPLRRCLQTARGVLGTEKLKENGAKLMARGELREILCCNGDYPLFTDQAMETFREFDFSGIENDIGQFGDFWFLNYLENSRSEEEFRDYAASISPETPKQYKIDFCLEMMKRRFLENHLVETNWDTYHRVQKFKKVVKEYIQTHDIKDDELVIVAHYRVIKSWTATGFDKDNDNYVGYVDAKNCQVVPYEM